jgi:hypothetical protein
MPISAWWVLQVPNRRSFEQTPHFVPTNLVFLLPQALLRNHKTQPYLARSSYYTFPKRPQSKPNPSCRTISKAATSLSRAAPRKCTIYPHRSDACSLKEWIQRPRRSHMHNLRLTGLQYSNKLLQPSRAGAESAERMRGSRCQGCAC